MKLLSITLQNFRQYYGRQKLDFSQHAERKVTIIHGVNGAGKTSFFLAINWCLYGRSTHDIKVIENVGELISKEAVHHAKVGEKVTTIVDLNFFHDGDRYTARRSLSGIKLPNGNLKLDDAEDFMVMMIEPNGQAFKVPNSIGVISSILPANVREYFLFDGEKIDNFAKPEAANQVKQAIYLVLNIEILERAQRHLDDLATTYRKELKGTVDGKLLELLEKDEKYREDCAKAEKRNLEVAREIDSAKRKIVEYDELLRNMQNARILQQQRDRINKDIEQRRQDLSDTVQRIASFATTSQVSIALPAINLAIEKLNEKRERGEIPSGIREQFIRDLLDQMICICGRSVADHSPEHNRLLSLLTSRLPNSVEDDILSLNASLKMMLNGLDERKQELDTQMRRRLDSSNNIDSLLAELDDIERQLEGSPHEEVSRLEEKRRECQNDIERLMMDAGSLGTQIANLNREIKQIEREIAEANKQQTQQRLQSKKLELAQQSADAIADIHHAFADDMRLKIEAKSKEIFKQLVWKDAHFQDIQLSPDFQLEVIDRYGKPARPELSAGERQVLSLSFIAAMSQISEDDAPLVMDTPFGRLSSQHRHTITQNLPKLAKQLVLFVTDEELRGEALENLRPYIGAEYWLHFDKTTSCTTINKESYGGN